MPTVFPAGIKVQGRIKVIYTPTMSFTAPSLAVLEGAGALDVSMMLFNWNPTATATRGAPRRRLGSTKVFETFGATTEAIGELDYVVDPQGAAGSDG